MKAPAWTRALGLILLCSAGSLKAEPQSAARLPRWRGFNLLEKFTLQGNKPYREQDFQWIRELGFDFVRLPLDYRIWIGDGDPRTFNEQALKEIDQAVEFGRLHQLHVSLNFHRAPGYCVNPPAETPDLWTSAEAQDLCALHWAAFARRYKGVPSSRLSFDLLNEPPKIDGKTYLAVARKLVEAIRKEDPERLVIADGSSWGNVPVPELASLGVAQSTRGYQPFGISHFRAGWIKGSDRWPLPRWPVRGGPGETLRGPGGPGPLILRLPPGGAARLDFRVRAVSRKARLLIRADGTPILDRTFEPGPGAGEWSKVVFRKEYDCYQNEYERDYAAEVPAGTKELRFEVVEGDWLSWSQLSLQRPPAAPQRVHPSPGPWGRPPGDFSLDAGGGIDPESCPVQTDRAALWKETIEPWKTLEASGVGVHVGEWGAFQHTPHATTLAWMEDCLRNWKEAGWGWALWNFRGSFGVLDSGRSDVVYEEWRGHRLDRKMLDLLQRY